jgi:hypothetical protein
VEKCLSPMWSRHVPSPNGCASALPGLSQIPIVARATLSYVSARTAQAALRAQQAVIMPIDIVKLKNTSASEAHHSKSRSSATSSFAFRIGSTRPISTSGCSGSRCPIFIPKTDAGRNGLSPLQSNLVPRVRIPPSRPYTDLATSQIPRSEDFWTSGCVPIFGFLAATVFRNCVEGR